MTPGSTTTRALGRSTSRMRFMRDRLMTMPFSTGSAPPLRPVPEPRATKGMRSRWQRRRMARTSAVEEGRRTAWGMARKFVGGAGAWGEEGGVHVRLGERILRRGKDGELGAMGGFVILQSIGSRPQSSRKILRMTRLMRGYRFSKALSRPKKAVHFFKNATYIF